MKTGTILDFFSKREKKNKQTTKKQFNTSLFSPDTFPGLSRDFVDYLFLWAAAIKCGPQTAPLLAELSIKRHSGWSNIPLLQRAEMLVDDSVFFCSCSPSGGEKNLDRFSIMKNGSEGEFISQAVRRHPGVVLIMDTCTRHMCTCAPCITSNLNSQDLYVKSVIMTLNDYH